jgi:putative oxidoreductase
MTTHVMFIAIGYALLGLFYVVGGVHHFLSFTFFAQMLAKRNILLPRLALALGSLFQIATGTLLALQVQVHASALGLAIFTLVASLILLDFWHLSGLERQAAMRSWQSNLAPTGALLVIGYT